MDHYGGGGSWGMISNVQNHGSSNPSTPSTTNLHPDVTTNTHLYNIQQQQQQQFFQQRPPQQPQQSLPSHFDILHLVENLAEVIENGTRDQHSDALVAEVTNQFEKCQQLLNSISGSINSRSMTLEGQKRKMEECEHLLNQRRDVISNYRNSVEELVHAAQL